MAKIRGKIKKICETTSGKLKALTIVRSLDRSDGNIEKDVILTDEEIQALRQSVASEEEKEEFNKWIDYYDICKMYYSDLAICYLNYQKSAINLLAFVQQWEDYQREAQHLTSLLKGLNGEGCGAAVDWMRENIPSLSFDGSELKEEADGSFKLHLKGMEGSLKRMSEQTQNDLREAKTYVSVISEWIDKNKCMEAVPKGILIMLNDINEDYGLGVALKYSAQELMKREKNGETILPEEREFAIVPSVLYTPIDEELRRALRRKLSRYEEIQKREG